MKRILAWLFLCVFLPLQGVMAAVQMNVEAETDTGTISTRKPFLTRISLTDPNDPAYVPDYEKVEWAYIKSGTKTKALYPVHNGNGLYSIHLKQAGNYTITAQYGSAGGPTYEFGVTADASYGLQESLGDLVSGSNIVAAGDHALSAQSRILSDVANRTKPRHLVGTEDNLAGDVTDVTSLLQSIANALITMAGALAVFIIVLEASFMITAFGNTDGMTQNKKGIKSAIWGLILIMFSYIIVRTAISFTFIGDSVPEDTNPLDSCSVESLTVMADIQAEIDKASDQYLRLSNNVESMQTRSRIANELAENMQGVPGMTSKDVSELIVKASEISQSTAEAQSKLDTAAQRILYFSGQIGGLEVECSQFKDSAISLQRFEIVKKEIMGSAGYTEALENTLQTAQTTIEQLDSANTDQFFEIFDKTDKAEKCTKDDLSKCKAINCEGLIQKDAGNGIQRCSLPTDYDADGVNNEIDQFPTDPLAF